MSQRREMRTVLRRPSKRVEDFAPTKVLAVDVADDMTDRLVGAYRHALVLIKHRGRPLGCVHVPCPDGTLPAAGVRAAMDADAVLTWRLRDAALRAQLIGDAPAALRRHSWSVIVCTRDRVGHLRHCLDGLAPMLRESGELVVVDNDPPDDATRQLVAQFPGVRYVKEPRRGLNAARMAGARTARGDILLYTDDDVVIDPGWIPALLRPFEAPRVGAATGLTMPLELETPAQAIFEYYGGHGRGFQPRVFDQGIIPPTGAGQAGSGANMAFRRQLVLDLGLFDAELDMGSVALTGGDAHGFYRVLAEGYQISYTPDALVWHRHREDYPSLRRMLYTYNVGGVAHLTRCCLEYGEWQALEVAAWWLTHHHLKQLYRTLRRKPDALPVDLTLSELAGFFQGPFAYFRARRIERARAAALSPAGAAA